MSDIKSMLKAALIGLVIAIALVAAFVAGRVWQSSPSQIVTTVSEEPSETSAQVVMTTYDTAAEIWDRLAPTSIPCEGKQRALSRVGTFIGCSFEGHQASIQTFSEPNKPATESDGPWENEDGQDFLVIVGGNWEIRILADYRAEVNHQLTEAVAGTLGGKVLSDN